MNFVSRLYLLALILQLTDHACSCLKDFRYANAIEGRARLPHFNGKRNYGSRSLRSNLHHQHHTPRVAGTQNNSEDSVTVQDEKLIKDIVLHFNQIHTKTLPNSTEFVSNASEIYHRSIALPSSEDTRPFLNPRDCETADATDKQSTRDKPAVPNILVSITGEKCFVSNNNGSAVKVRPKICNGSISPGNSIHSTNDIRVFSIIDQDFHNATTQNGSEQIMKSKNDDSTRVEHHADNSSVILVLKNEDKKNDVSSFGLRKSPPGHEILVRPSDLSVDENTQVHTERGLQRTPSKLDQNQTLYPRGNSILPTNDISVFPIIDQEFPHGSERIVKPQNDDPTRVEHHADNSLIVRVLKNEDTESDVSSYVQKKSPPDHEILVRPSDLSVEENTQVYTERELKRTPTKLNRNTSLSSRVDMDWINNSQSIDRTTTVTFENLDLLPVQQHETNPARRITQPSPPTHADRQHPNAVQSDWHRSSAKDQVYHNDRRIHDNTHTYEPVQHQSQNYPSGDVKPWNNQHTDSTAQNNNDRSSIPLSHVSSYHPVQQPQEYPQSNLENYQYHISSPHINNNQPSIPQTYKTRISSYKPVQQQLLDYSYSDVNPANYQYSENTPHINDKQPNTYLAYKTPRSSYHSVNQNSLTYSPIVEKSYNYPVQTDNQHRENIQHDARLSSPLTYNSRISSYAPQGLGKYSSTGVIPFAPSIEVNGVYSKNNSYTIDNLPIVYNDRTFSYHPVTNGQQSQKHFPANNNLPQYPLYVDNQINPKWKRQSIQTVSNEDYPPVPKDEQTDSNTYPARDSPEGNNAETYPSNGAPKSNEHSQNFSQLSPEQIQTYYAIIHNLMLQNNPHMLKNVENEETTTVVELTTKPTFVTRERDNDGLDKNETEVEKQERLHRKYEKMIQFVNILGQVDSYITDRARSAFRAISRVYDDDREDRRYRARYRKRE